MTLSPALTESPALPLCGWTRTPGHPLRAVFFYKKSGVERCPPVRREAIFYYKANELKKLLLKASISEKEFEKLWLFKKNLKKPELKKNETQFLQM
jgi:hypothetical protein